MSDVIDKEVNEAIYAGERALNSLRTAENCLQSASNWGLFDMFGGGGFISLIKRGKMRDANNYIEQARYDLDTFRKEIKDVQMYVNIDFGYNGFISFADIFMDNFFVDFMVQSQISNTKNQVREAIYQVENALNRLRTIY